MQEYGIISSRLTGVDTWGHQFVSIYFAFTAALMAAIGFISSKKTMLNEENFVHLFGSSPLGNSLLVIISVVGLILSLWAPSFVLKYHAESKILFNRLVELEKNIGTLNPENCFTHKSIQNRDSFISLYVSTSITSVVICLIISWTVMIIAFISES